MLADNIVYLKKQNPALYKALKKEEETVMKQTIFFEKTRNNQQTIKVIKEGRTNYVHSKYDPLKEAETIVEKLEQQEKIANNTHIIFYGLGLGYHIDVFVKKHPNVDFSIYEPSLEVLSCYLQKKSLLRLPEKNLKGISGEYDETAVQTFFNDHIGMVQKQIVFCHLPAYEKVFEDQYNHFFSQAKAITKNKRGGLHTNYAYKKRWIFNSVINFGEVLKSPNIIMENNGVFKNKPVMLVSAGPSLDFEIENLRVVRERGLAYIFTVGSAINTLIQNDIFPDAMCTYDPKESNQIVFSKINELQINTIPMIFGSSVGFETLQQYQGPKFVMLTNQDTISNYFLKTNSEDILDSVHDAPSIAVVALELLSKLEFGEIYLVGQNLAYLDRKNYADGIEYHKNELSVNENDLVKATDVMGETVFTTDSYLIMKSHIEQYIKKLGLTVVNTTQGGIHIEGANFMTMEKVLSEKLTVSAIKNNIFNEIKHTDLYDRNYLKKQWLVVKQAYDEYQGLLTLMKQQLLKIDELVRNKNTKQASIMYQQFDVLVTKLEDNVFAKIFVLPMNRVEHEVLSVNVKRLKKEKNVLKRIENLVKNMAAFVALVYRDSHLNQQMMGILEEYIN